VVPSIAPLKIETMTYKLMNYFDFSDFHKALQVIRSFFVPEPVTPSQIAAQKQSTIEDCAGYLSKEIANCTTLTALYEATDAVRYFRTAWQDDTQAQAWYDSLMLQITNKGAAICKK
jgi:hypothetical protein